MAAIMERPTTNNFQTARDDRRILREIFRGVATLARKRKSSLPSFLSWTRRTTVTFF